MSSDRRRRGRTARREGVAPDRDPAVAVMVVEEHDERPAAREPGRRAVRELFGDVRKRQADFSDAVSQSLDVHGRFPAYSRCTKSWMNFRWTYVIQSRLRWAASRAAGSAPVKAARSGVMLCARRLKVWYQTRSRSMRRPLSYSTDGRSSTCGGTLRVIFATSAGPSISAVRRSARWGV